MNKAQIINEIRAMNLPARAKALLEDLSQRSSTLGSWIISMIRNHPGAPAVGISIAVGILLTHLSLIAGSVICLGTIVGLLTELRSVLTRKQ